MPPKSIKGKERLAIQGPRQRPLPRIEDIMQIEGPHEVMQLPAPSQIPQIESLTQFPLLQSPKPKPGPLIISGKDKRTYTLRGTVNSVLSRLIRDKKNK